MFAPSLRAAAGLAGIVVAALSIAATASHATDLGKDDEVAIRGTIVAADPGTRMIIVESPDRDTLSYPVLPCPADHGRLIGGRYLQAAAPRRDRRPALLSRRRHAGRQVVSRGRQAGRHPGLRSGAGAGHPRHERARPALGASAGGLHRLAARRSTSSIQRRGYRTPWIKSAEDRAAATLKPGDGHDGVQRTYPLEVVRLIN